MLLKDFIRYVKIHKSKEGAATILPYLRKINLRHMITDDFIKVTETDDRYIITTCQRTYLHKEDFDVLTEKGE